ncbi:hypothetical protein ACHQM5_002708 [Ranunculus cassubicifolius]
MRQAIQQIFVFLLSISSSLTTRWPPVSFSADVETKQTIEHIFLFRCKENTDQATINYLIQELDNLRVIPGVLSLTTGPVNRLYSSSSPSLDFGIFFHSRFETKEALDAYMHHPQHLKLNHDLTDPLLGDYMLIDWVYYHKGELAPPPGSAMRVTFLKLKQGLNLVQKEKSEVFKVIGNNLGRSVEQYTYGENFAIAAKGFSISSFAVFLDEEEMKRAGSCGELAKQLENELNHLVESVLVIDYVV